MDVFDVELRDATGRITACELDVAATSAETALRDVASLIPPSHGNNLYVVYRHGKVGGRRLQAQFRVRVEGGGKDGTAGVREPRRPNTGPGHLVAAIDRTELGQTLR